MESFARAPSSAASQIWSHTKWAAATVGASRVTAARRANTTAVATTRAKSSAALLIPSFSDRLACPPARSSSHSASAAARSPGPWQTAHAAAAGGALGVLCPRLLDQCQAPLGLRRGPPECFGRVATGSRAQPPRRYQCAASSGLSEASQSAPTLPAALPFAGFKRNALK